LFSYYRTYVKDFAAITKPLTDLTGARKPAMLQWGDAEQQAFDSLRRVVCKALCWRSLFQANPSFYV